MSHTRLVFMVPRTSVTVCKSVFTHSFLYVVADNSATRATSIRARTTEIHGIHICICRRARPVISLPFDVNYYRGRINANERRAREKC